MNITRKYSVRNRGVIELSVGGVLMYRFSVGVGDFVIGLRQIFLQYIFMHRLFRMNVMLDFICMSFVDTWQYIYNIDYILACSYSSVNNNRYNLNL